MVAVIKLIFMGALKINVLLISFFSIFTAYGQYTVNTVNDVLLQEKVAKLKKSEEVQGFINRAQKAHVFQAKIDSIIYAKVKQDYQIAALKEHTKSTNKNLLITITDPKFDKNSCIRAYRKTVSTLLSKEQFQYIYKELLDLQIEREASQTYADLNEEYTITKESDTKVIKKWVLEYTTKAVLAQQYHAYNKKLSQTKYEEVLAEAADKYNEVLAQLKVASVNPLAVEETPEELFVKQAKIAGVTEAIANRIIALSKDTKKQIKAIEKLNKSNTPHIYLLETTKNSKDAVRKQFKGRLAQLINIQQFKKLFGEQLQEDIQTNITNQMQQITSVYPLNEAEYTDMESLVTDYVNKNLVAKHYYGYDKKLLKQKQKVIKFKFDSAYKKKIKAMIAAQ